MKRTELLKRARRIARDNGTNFDQLREGGAHTVFVVQGQRVSIPRHAEIKDRLANDILDVVEQAAKGGH